MFDGAIISRYFLIIFLNLFFMSLGNMKKHYCIIACIIIIDYYNFNKSLINSIMHVCNSGSTINFMYNIVICIKK
jgi:hypothetical protein